MARAIMFQGTGSDVGKSVLVAGLCRVARNRGLNVRPFKPQNMSNNAAVSDDGGEIGRAQWLQALACGVSSSVHMNPVLLKPQTDMGSQVVVQGQVRGEARGRYYQELKPQLMAAVMESFAKVSEGVDLVLVEGAGSPAEINLRAGDIANMGFATQADVPVVLVGDIDRGGVIASLVGTHTILSEQDRAMVRGFLINKFRGDISLFDDGLAAITRFTGWRSFGVVPWLKAVSRLPAEDSVVLERAVRGDKKPLVVAVPMLPRIANFDDLDPLKAEPDVEVVMVPPGSSIPGDAGLVVLPGTKSTIADMQAVRDNGWDRQLSAHVKRGGHVLGICGGFQMLGRHISDPAGIEGHVRDIDGLGLLDIETVMEPEKVVRNVQATALLHNVPLEGYEIHIGRTTGPDMGRPFARIGEHDDGAISPDGHIMGTYLHGVFNADEFRRRFLEDLGVRSSSVNYRAGVEAALDELAEGLDACLDIDALFNLK
ncbi:cobyric acid synthase [Brucella anthropi]|jgi:adenosylcobyric acid synthase|uniref:Cobyric acid synthase n=1 Tax=Brucella anthropi TaxID=529 RepID=A0A011VHX7_BRUAN|nr:MULTISPECIES: cobyric acid synthase [Brucella/Ochrobactrum group]MCR5942957.1 cobyric acid synthase [Ochrobactrum sp. XJ1]QTN03004.1 cobyric acid synthase [Ochrobactrum sp. EEELCW01]EXL08025.1 cobalamin biosynthesis protein CobQ [Brucella anthropi]KAB2737920.1 cobyric acid synthase [Brucella anthropi]KAB2760367.1 cobyric acid synthase [Brucella anthropi]